MKTKPLTIITYLFLFFLTISPCDTIMAEPIITYDVPPELSVAKGWSRRFEGKIVSTIGNLTKVTAVVTLTNDQHDSMRTMSLNQASFYLNMLPPFDSNEFESYGLDEYRVGIWAKSETVTNPKDPLNFIIVKVIEPDITISLEGDHESITDSESVIVTATATDCETPNFLWESVGGEIKPENSQTSNPNQIKWVPPDVERDRIFYVICTFSPSSAPNNRFNHFIKKKYKIIVSPEKVEIDNEKPIISSIIISKSNLSIGDTIDIKWGAYDKKTDFNNLTFHLQYSEFLPDSDVFNDWIDIEKTISNTSTLTGWSPPNISNQLKVRIRATDQSGNISLWKESDEITVHKKETERPLAPELKLYSINEKSKPEIKLRWQKVLDSNKVHNADYYKIQCSQNVDNITQKPKIDIHPDVPGKNIFERLTHTIDTCNDNLLKDNSTYYVRIAGVNKEGVEGDWSNAISSEICIQDDPFFDETFQEPEDEQKNVLKNPILKWKAKDNENDALDYYVTLGTDRNNLFSKRPFRSDREGINEYNVAEESGKSLLPGTKYFWQIWVKEVGKRKEDYGGEYIKSPIWSFTTALTGSDPAIVGIEQIGDIQPNSSVLFKLKIQNMGTKQATPQYIKSFYVKNGNSSPFLNGEGDMKQYLDPDQIEYVEIELFFRDEIINKYDVEYDNILIPGNSQIKFCFANPDQYDISLSNNEKIVSITYTDTKQPEINYIELKATGITNVTDYFWAIREEPLIIYVGVKDDDKISKCTYEYRLNQNDNWEEFYTEEDNSKLQQYNQSCSWDIPDKTPQTDTAQIKVSVFDNQNNKSEKISNLFSIYSSEIRATIETDKTIYQTGDTLNYSISFHSANIITFAEILLEVGSNHEYLKEFDPKGATSGQYQWSIPHGYLSKNCYLLLKLIDNRKNEKEFRSEIFGIRANTELPPPFNETITMYDEEKSIPPNAMDDSQKQEIIFTQLDDNNKVHCIIEHEYKYYEDTANDDDHEDSFTYVNDKYYITYDPVSKQISNPVSILNKDYKILDFTLFDSKPFILLQRINYEQLYFQYKEGSDFTSQQIIENSAVPKMLSFSTIDINNQLDSYIPERYVYLNDYLWLTETYLTNTIRKYAFNNGEIGERKLVNIQNNAGNTMSMESLNSITDANDIYFIDYTGKYLIQLDTENLIMNSFQLPITISNKLNELNKVDLIAKNNNVFIFANAKVYQFNGSSITEKNDITYTINNETINYAQNDTWVNVDNIKAVKTENSIYLIIDEKPDFSMPVWSKFQKILKFDISSASFSMHVVDTEEDIHIMHDYKIPNKFDMTYLSNNKVLIAFGLDQGFGSIHDYHSFLKMLDLETGQVNYLGQFNLKSLGKISIINSDGNLFVVADNKETDRIDIMRLNLSSLGSTKQIEDVQFIKLDNNLHVTWGNGVPYNGTWDTNESCLKNDVLKQRKVKQVYPTSSEITNLSDLYIDGKLNVCNNYVSSSKEGDVYLWRSDTNSAQLIKDLENFNSHIELKFYQSPYISGFQKDINQNKEIILLKEDYSQSSFHYSYWQNYGTLFKDEAIFVGNNITSSNQIILSKFNYSSQTSTDLILNDTGNYYIDAVPEKIDINQNKYVAIVWDNVLALGDLSKDMILPEISFTHIDRTVQQGDILTLSWVASDNNQLKKIEIYKNTNDSFELLSTINDTDIATYPYQVNDTNEITFKVVAYDIDNNTASETIHFTIIPQVTFQSFSISPSEVEIGKTLTFFWKANHANFDSEYTVCIRKPGDTDWTKCITAKGVESESISITQKPGTYECIIFSRDDSHELETPLTITGEYISFSHLDFNPTIKSYYVYDQVIDFEWDINNHVNDTVKYSLMIRKENEDEYQKIDTVTNTNYRHFIAEPINSFSWMIEAEFQGNRYTSIEFHVQLKQLISCNFESIELKDNHTNSPYIIIDFTPVDDADQYEVSRSDRQGNEVNILIPKDYDKFTDTQIQYGEQYQYIISSIKGNLKSESQLSEVIFVNSIIPLGVTIHTPDYQLLDSNEITITYSPTPDNCYERYEIMYRSQDMTDFQSFSKTSQRQISLNNLLYCTKYYVKVQPLNYDGQHVGQCDMILFTTGTIPVPDVTLNLNVDITNEKSKGSATLLWTIGNDSNAQITGIDIEKRKADKYYQSIFQSDDIVFSYTDSNLEPGSYTYRIRVYNNGGFSDYSNEIAITIDSDEAMCPPKYYVKGNPADPVWTMYIQNAFLDNQPLAPGDEIGIFDGETLVGAFQLLQLQPLSSENVFKNFITVWSTINDGPGYQAGNKYSLKCWDCSEQNEFNGKVIFNNDPDIYPGNYNKDVFPLKDKEYSIVSFNFYSEIEQTINLRSGYQIISFNALIQSSAEKIFSSITPCLDFVRNDKGNMFRKIGTQWIDNIENISIGDGILVKMNCPVTLTVKGKPIDPQTPIALSNGYRLLAYLPEQSFTALQAFNSILDQLDFARNSKGQMLRKIGDNWIDNMNPMQPGEGILIKMHDSDTLVYPASAQVMNNNIRKNRYLREIDGQATNISHFPAIMGNPFHKVWTIYFKNVTINGRSIEVGDELAIYDNDEMVGSVIINQDVNESNWHNQVLTVWSTISHDNDGFRSGNTFKFKCWDKSRALELSKYLIVWDDIEAYKNNTFPDSDGEYSVISLDFKVSLETIIILLKELVGIRSEQYQNSHFENDKIGLEDVIHLLKGVSK